MSDNSHQRHEQNKTHVIHSACAIACTCTYLEHAPYKTKRKEREKKNAPNGINCNSFSSISRQNVHIGINNLISPK